LELDGLSGTFALSLLSSHEGAATSQLKQPALPAHASKADETPHADFDLLQPPTPPSASSSHVAATTEDKESSAPTDRQRLISVVAQLGMANTSFKSKPTSQSKGKRLNNKKNKKKKTPALQQDFSVEEQALFSQLQTLVS